MAGFALLGYSVTTAASIMQRGVVDWLSIISVPPTTVITVLFFVLSVGVTHLMTQWLGGTGTFSQLLYVSATFSAPLKILGIAAPLFPHIGLFCSFLCAVYGFILEIIATKAVHRFSWTKAILAVMPAILGAVILYVATLVAIAFLSQYVDLSQFIDGG
jgi:hypothetical protein